MARTSDTKQKLIDAASDLIWRNSYNAVSVEEICTQAGVNKGSFYHYFPSKAHLAMASMDSGMQETIQFYDTLFSCTRPPMERLEGLIDHIVVQQEEKYQQLGHVGGCPFALVGTELAAQEDSIGAQINDIISQKAKYYEAALRDLVEEGRLAADTDIKAASGQLCAIIIGQLMMARIRNDLTDLKPQLQAAIYGVLGLKREEKELTDQSNKTYA
ncbi:MAG: TetR family transcriptional regulator [Rickettsiales bacterium]|nr:TetR family transcriptional regulator [Rickettsiales bacterium]|tara:strand:- start:3701 stop:4345 length:645 start_codon:yes stop_codon:yes gene_type:complete